MYFRDCKLMAFGHFRDREIRDIDNALVVVLGPNEAGKSTFFQFLQTMLFGIYPTSPESHRYAPRDGTSLEGSADLVLGAGQTLSVTRRLTRTPQGRLQNGSDLEMDLRNKPVPAAEFVSHRVFDAIYALDLHDMTALKDRAWADVQDRLLAGFNLDFLRSARSVLDELDREANDLWRDDRRGRPLSKRLREERDEWVEKLAQSRERESELQTLNDEVRQHAEQLRLLRDEQVQLQAVMRHHDRIGPIAVRWSKIKGLMSASDNVESFSSIPENPVAILEEWHRRDEEYTKQIDDIAEEEDERELERGAAEDHDHLILTHADEIHAWSRRAGAHEANLANLRGVGIELCEIRYRMNVIVESLATPEGKMDLLRQIPTIEAEKLRSHVLRLEDAEEKLASARARDQHLATQLGSRKLIFPMLIVLAGIVVGAFGIMKLQSLMIAAGAAILVGGVIWLAMTISQQRLLRKSRIILGLDRLRQSCSEHREEVERLLAPLHVKEDQLETPGRDLVARLLQLYQLFERRSERTKRAGTIVNLLDTNRREIRQLLKSVDIPYDFDVLTTVSVLENRLEEAENRIQKSEDARQRLFKLRRDRERIRSDQQALQDQIAQIEAVLRKLGDGDKEEGAAKLEEMRRSKIMADHHMSLLDQDHPTWRDYVSDIDKLSDAELNSYTEAARMERDAKRDEILKKIDFESIRHARKRAQLQQLQKHRTVADVESEIALIDEKMSDARRRRDELVLLANVIRRADQQFRFRHQPDVIRIASGYLSKITAGRYVRLMLQDDSGDLMVFEQASQFPITVDESLSQGTRDQIYLSIRFALMDHLDENQERLPAFLDEVFVNWDQERRMLGYQILKDLAARRQVFVFTCHPWLAAEIQSVVEAQLIELANDTSTVKEDV